jgi:hypothetical protein
MAVFGPAFWGRSGDAGTKLGRATPLRTAENLTSSDCPFKENFGCCCTVWRRVDSSEWMIVNDVLARSCA